VATLLQCCDSGPYLAPSCEQVASKTRAIKLQLRPYSMVAHPGPEDDIGSNMNILTTKWEKQYQASIISINQRALM